MFKKIETNRKFDIMQSVIAEAGGNISNFIKERSCHLVKYNNQELFLEYHISIPKNAYSTVATTKCKDLTYTLLKKSNLPTPNTVSFYRSTYNKKAAFQKLQNLKYPIIVKDATGSNSLGIVLNIQNPLEALAVVKQKIKQFRSLVAQEMVNGKEYRILVLQNKIIGGLEMIHPNVIGDGKYSIKTLIKLKQKETKRKTKFDKTLKQMLASQNTRLTSVPENGEVIYIKGNSCIAEGGETKDITDLIHEDVRKICIRTTEAVGKDLIGIDIICEDISLKPTKETFNLLEVNGKPDYFIHYNPTYGKTRNVLKNILDHLTKH